LLCTNCGLPLAGGDEAALFICPGCGQVHEVGDDGLKQFPVSTAAPTTELAVPGPVQHLAIWRLLPGDPAGDDGVWERIRRVAAPGPAYIYVPAFSMARSVVQRIGVRLTEVQPALELAPGGPAGPGLRPAPVGVGPGMAHPEEDDMVGAPDFEGASPILIGQREAWGLAHFVFMAVEARETHDLRPVDLRLEPGGEELLFLPAVWDPRYIYESNWRLLLREFDGLVA
jgi:hypothetical protein